MAAILDFESSWSGLVRVDNTHIFEYLGAALENPSLAIPSGTNASAASLTNLIITPTRTIMTVDAGTFVTLNVTFLSPIETEDIDLASLEFFYVSVDVESKDGNEHSVQLYMDVSGEWASFDSGAFIQWNTTTSSSGNVIYHTVQKQPGEVESMVENDGMAEDLGFYYGALASTGATYQTGADHDVRSQFIGNGQLKNSQDTAFRAIQDSFPVFAFCRDLGSISSTGDSPIVWTIGIVRDKSILYPGVTGTEGMRPAWLGRGRWDGVGSAIEFLLASSSSAVSRAESLDEKVLNDANGVSAQYADLVALAARQVVGGIEIAVPSNPNDFTTSAGNPDKIYMFLRDTGFSARAQPVEVLYSAWPAILYLNATWGRYLLEPLLMYEGSRLYEAGYAAPDLGSSYPSIQGNPSPNLLRSIDDSSSMLIMAWIHARVSGDGGLIGEYYDLFKKWTDQLVPNTLTPNGFTTSDGQSSANMTNLALKGILGIRAMAEMSGVMGKGDDEGNYKNVASKYISQWTSLSGSSSVGHLESVYGDTASWGLMYNLFADKWMGTGLVGDDIYTQQTQYYANQAQNSPSFGLEYDSKVDNVAKSHWTLFTASVLTDSSVRDTLISQVHTHANDQKNPGVFPSTYNVNDGSTIGGSASPAVGGLYSLLALNNLPTANKITGLSGSSSSSSNSSRTGAIVGGVIGALAALAVIGLGIALWRRKKQNRREGAEGVKKGGAPTEPLDGYDYEVVPHMQNGTNTPTGEYNPYASPTFPNPHPYEAQSQALGATSAAVGGSEPLSPTTTSRYSVHQQYPQGVAPPTSPSSYHSQSQTSSSMSRSQGNQLRLYNPDAEHFESGDVKSSSLFSTPQAPPLPTKRPLGQVRLSVEGVEGLTMGGLGLASGSGQQQGQSQGSRLGQHRIVDSISNRSDVTDSNSVQAGDRERVTSLRNEVDNLRREMAEMRERTGYEPPPQYQ
ncbi:hypothetical protein VKT23_008545 [Stygiomarasmius scandens]|uniref:DUF1793-domain-containing protein n=1 Tax=Marasmiellus scandens TaxID=2682957 RepID=A0ABR1JL01_9AGAR